MNEKQNWFIVDFGREFFRIVNPGGKKWGCSDFKFGEEIPVETITGLRNVFTNLDLSLELPLIYVREDLSGPIDQGILLTTDYLYYNLMPDFSKPKYMIKQISLDELKIFEIKPKIFSADLLINGQEVAKIKGWAKIIIYDTNILLEFVYWLISIRKALKINPDGSELKSKSTMAASNVERLIYLFSMYQNGILTPEEYAIAWTRLIIKMVAERRVQNGYR